MEKFIKAANILQQAKNVVFLGGAGVSTESNIKDFRSNTGLFKNNFHAEDLISIKMFLTKPELFFDFYFSEMIHPTAKPNKAHILLSKLENQGILKTIITQNIDGLHQAAGSKNVIEIHGNIYENHCTNCHKQFTLDYMINNYDKTVKCDNCQSLIKPNVTLYGEALNERNWNKAVNFVSSADVLIIGGTSLKVYPAASLLNYFHGKHIIIIDKDEIHINRHNILFFQMKISDCLQTIFDCFN